MMAILDEREGEAAALRRRLATKSDKRQEKRLLLDRGATALSPVVEAAALPANSPSPPLPPPLPLPTCEEAPPALPGGKRAAAAAAAADVPLDRCNVEVSMHRNSITLEGVYSGQACCAHKWFRVASPMLFPGGPRELNSSFSPHP